MKKYLLLIVALVLVFKAKDIYWTLRPLPQFSATQNEVILYSTEWCSYCARARSLLDRVNVPYKEYDIEASEYRYKQFIALGGRGVPLMIVNGKKIGGWAPDKMIEYLVEN